jgi:hypothetical protein
VFFLRNTISPYLCRMTRQALTKDGLLGVRVREVGESECQAVMVWIPVEAKAYITGRESGPTSDRSFITRH